MNTKFTSIPGITIGTHSGNFQCDDVMAVAMLRMLYPELEIVRTREKHLLYQCTFVVDVGGEYNHDHLRYDHHQTGGGGQRENGIKYSACGLVWKHYGAEICGSQEVADRVDAHFVQSIDATDCGQHLYEGGHSNFPGVRGSSISSMIASLNPTWDEEPEYDQRFAEAVTLGTVFLMRAIVAAKGAAKAEARVRADIQSSPDPRVIVLSEPLPWQEVVVREAPEALYVVYLNEAGTWMAQGAPSALGSFKTKHSPPALWGGKDGAALKELTGVEDAIFCHNNLFIMGAGSLCGILQLVNISLLASSQGFASYYEETPDEAGEFVLVVEQTGPHYLKEVRRDGFVMWEVTSNRYPGTMEFSRIRNGYEAAPLLAGAAPNACEYATDEIAKNAAREWYTRCVQEAPMST